MLLRFGRDNYRSMKDRQELSLILSALDDVRTGLISCPAAPEGHLLPLAVIYGPKRFREEQYRLRASLDGLSRPALPPGLGARR